MAVTAFDGNFSFKQEELARMGGFKDASKMTPQQWAEFQESPFMKSIRKCEAACYDKTCERDKKRAEKDEEFKPQDSDWNAPKAFEYEKAVNNYKVLGVDEYATLAEMKQAYKKLSLVYHPDKTAGMTQKEKDESNAIFIELKNAYKTLADQATRRQYDRDRDRDRAALEVNGWKLKVKQAFDATELLKRLQHEQKARGKIVDIPTRCRLEKFVWGGSKAITRERKIKDVMDFKTEERSFRLNVAKGAAEGFEVMFQFLGDHQEETQPDSLNFVVASKLHEVVDRIGDDLIVRQKLAMRPDAHTQPYLSVESESVRGRHLALWGRNPFYRSTGAGKGEIHFRVLGEGVTPQGSLRLTACLGASPDIAHHVIVRIKQITTGAQMAMRIPTGATMGDVRVRAQTLLDFGGTQNVKVMKETAGGYAVYPDEQPLGTLRSLTVGGTSWTHVPVAHAQAEQLLQAVVGASQSEAFQADLAAAFRLVEKSKAEAESAVNGVWSEVCHMLPDYGFDSDVATLRDVVQRALEELEDDDDTVFLRAQAKNVVIGFNLTRFAEVGGGGVPVWGIRGHPAICRREKARLSFCPSAQIELTPFGSAVLLRTKPPCNLILYSNLKQAARAPLGQLNPKPMFGFSLSSSMGSKKRGMASWLQVKDTLVPMLQASVFHLVKEARGILPRPLSNVPFFAGGYNQEEDVSEYSSPVHAVEALAATYQEEEEEEEEEEDEEEDDDSDGGGCGGFFDFDDLDDDEEAEEDKRQKKEAKAMLKQAQKVTRQVMARERIEEERRRLYVERIATSASPSASSRLVPWKRLGDEAYRNGDLYRAANYYSSRLLEDRGAGDRNDFATVYADRSACLAKLGQFEAALADAKEAVNIRHTWGEAWGRVGLAASKLELADEARDAYFKAVQFEPTPSNIEALHTVTQSITERSAEQVSIQKEKGNTSLQSGDVSHAIALYTRSLALLPEAEGADPIQSLKCILCCNRSLAFAQRQDWDAAISDGAAAVAAKETCPKARYRLGTALLGSGQHEKAYVQFAFGLLHSPSDKACRKGRDTCLTLFPLWRSVPARSRFRSRFSMDAHRPRGSSKIYAMSDIHFDHKANPIWVENIDDFKFQEDTLIVAGNMADTLSATMRGLRVLKAKFRRIFFTPGNHEMWLHPSELSKYPDSIAKMHALMQACDEEGVDVMPAAICEDVFVVPLLSWYSAEFDEKDPYPDPRSNFDKHCRWPMDVATQVPDYMLALNHAHLELPYHGTVITFSHFLPRIDLPYDKSIPKYVKTIGCEEIQVQAQAVRSKAHIFGHTRRKHARLDNGILFVQHSLGYDTEHTETEPIMCVFNGVSETTRAIPIKD